MGVVAAQRVVVQVSARSHGPFPRYQFDIVIMDPWYKILIFALLALCVLALFFV